MATHHLRSADSERPGSDSVPATPATEAIRDALALRHGEWDARRAGVLDLAAEALAELHGALVGRVARLEQLRPAKYMRGALRGEHAQTRSFRRPSCCRGRRSPSTCAAKSSRG
jgi:hypothetical protein